MRLRLGGRRLGVGLVPALRCGPGLVGHSRPSAREYDRAMTRRIVGALLIAVMAVGSVLLWSGIPGGWLDLASRPAGSPHPSMGPCVLVLGGIRATMIVGGKLLAALDRTYGRVTGTASRARVQARWPRSMRGDRHSTRPRSVLDVVMVCSVALAVVCFAVWFLLFAGSSLPTT